MSISYYSVITERSPAVTASSASSAEAEATGEASAVHGQRLGLRQEASPAPSPATSATVIELSATSPASTSWIPSTTLPSRPPTSTSSPRSGFDGNPSPTTLLYYGGAIVILILSFWVCTWFRRRRHVSMSIHQRSSPLPASSSSSTTVAGPGSTRLQPGQNINSRIANMSREDRRRLRRARYDANGGVPGPDDLPLPLYEEMPPKYELHHEMTALRGGDGPDEDDERADARGRRNRSRNRSAGWLSSPRSLSRSFGFGAAARSRDPSRARPPSHASAISQLEAAAATAAMPPLPRQDQGREDTMASPTTTSEGAEEAKKDTVADTATSTAESNDAKKDQALLEVVESSSFPSSSASSSSGSSSAAFPSPAPKPASLAGDP
ncbi:hypothetical protein HDU96_010231 [Phlyctochytrium bullatum]|nr:hypothetical protein HDU96_010231 [Phlyctochytrium bullatum]